MTIGMKDNSIKSVSQLQALIKAAEALGVETVERLNGKDEVYAWMNDLLLRLKYRSLRKKDKGIVRKYLRLYSGYTESHIDHLISAYAAEGMIRRKKRTQPVFPTTYAGEDIELLAEVAEAYDHQNGRALKEVCREMFAVHGDERFKRLAKISVSRLYDFKQDPRFKEKTLHYTKTRPAPVAIGERKKPYPQGKPGFLRVDSVHQGDKDKEKGVYHINLVDEVTQWEITVCVEGISEAFLAPALEEALETFPFTILNFHSDNGSEYINKVVAKLLEKLRINQTKSRSRKTNDNALVEGKNGAVIRKHMGYMHIPKRHAVSINKYYRMYRNPFVNFHRFSAFPDEEIDTRGKIIKKYRTYLTPCQKLLSIPLVEACLKAETTCASLETEMQRQSHLAAAREMQKEKSKLFNSFSSQKML
ncbi:MAG: integrase [Candidatus Vogelbacteria bacterium CG10_big_fil_rev_8_21_14_0_10_45_14]|uniref:Integrase n=1 Tax=Candidatus Vogelbacteria bacterium CG10_big_fil_rev_8_21_14_0_10_45_14 TaxID=1975042 RepID=A0A2H0RJ20_9BACT|nr:MAG: integrase [Candidatus Vogelbacteria bacterium CG10_big_fil_rev_8_21_14_0_10_45_14]